MFVNNVALIKIKKVELKCEGNVAPRQCTAYACYRHSVIYLHKKAAVATMFSFNGPLCLINVKVIVSTFTL